MYLSEQEIPRFLECEVIKYFLSPSENLESFPLFVSSSSIILIFFPFF